MSVATAVARQQETRPTIAGVIAQLKPEIARALPRGLDADRVARLALTAVRKDRNLAQCSPESFAGALLTAAALGLDPGINGEAYLVPYKGECTLIVGYQGLARLYFQHPMAKTLTAQAVHANDHFDFAYGTAPYLTHRPALGGPDKRGPIIAYYAAATLANDAVHFVVLTPEEIADLRATTRKPQIADPQHWMERKTVLRQLFKLLPKSTQMNQAIDADERPGSELHREQVIANRPALEQADQPPHQTAEPGGGDPDVDDGVVTGELLDDDQDAEGGQPVGRTAVTRIHAMFGERQVKDRAERLRILSEFTGRTITSSNELTKVEASRLIDWLATTSAADFAGEGGFTGQAPAAGEEPAGWGQQ